MADERRPGREFAVAIALFAATYAGTAVALVGAAAPVDATSAAQVVMVLTRSKAAAGFCSGVVIAPRVVLTAAHCVATPADTRVHLADPTTPALLSVDAIAVHPGYRADAVRSRQRSVDLALVRLAAPLPQAYTAARLGTDAPTDIGAPVELAGFGLADARAPTTGGTLRRGTAHLRAPYSEMLFWLDGPAYGCTGDSGGPVRDVATGAVIGVIAWAQGAGGRACGALTQAIRLAPARDWIASVRAAWPP